METTNICFSIGFPKKIDSQYRAVNSAIYWSARKIQAKITIIVVVKENLIILLLFINVKKSRDPYSLIRCWLQLLTTMRGLVTIRSMGKHDVHPLLAV